MKDTVVSGEGKTCKTCKWLDVKPDKAGRRVVRKNKAYRCAWPDPEQPTLPKSITKSYGWRSWPPSRSMVYADISDCPTWAALAASKSGEKNA